MDENLATLFLTFYIRSLRERTRDETSGTKHGFDWVIYNLSIAETWIPHRLSFVRTGPDETSQPKYEAEFGIDLAFISQDGRRLRIFVLKDEVLNNRNWTANGFDIDLRKAAAPDLSMHDTASVETVEVILAYNKDEDHNGTVLYNRLVAGLGTRCGDRATLEFYRWNLTTIVEKTRATLLSAALLPQKFYSQFSYICSQYGDFRHGSNEWNNQLIPNWRRFLLSLLAENADERCVRLLPVALLILQVQAQSNPTKETGWIDLCEWGIIAAWEVSRLTSDTSLKAVVGEIWGAFYLVELERYYRTHSEYLAVPFSVDKPSSCSFVDAIASAAVAHWHMGRIGILGLSYSEFLPMTTPEDIQKREATLVEVSDWLVGLLNANPSTMRPLIDLNHIELFLVWRTLLQAGRDEDVSNWIAMLTHRLCMRRFGQVEIPFICTHHSLDLVFECVATKEKPYGFRDTSSVYLMCLMELLIALPTSRREEILPEVYRLLVKGKSSDNEQVADEIDLMSWMPAEDWEGSVLTRSMANTGECITIRFGEFGHDEAVRTDSEIKNGIESLVRESRSKRRFKWPSGIPLSVIVLACLKHISPLPPESWRQSIFPPQQQSSSKKKKTASSPVAPTAESKKPVKKAKEKAAMPKDTVPKPKGKVVKVKGTVAKSKKTKRGSS